MAPRDAILPIPETGGLGPWKVPAQSCLLLALRKGIKATEWWVKDFIKARLTV